MSLTARVFRTFKRKNSTLQPAPGSSYEVESIQLKESTDVVHPTFTFNKGMAWNPSALYNYMDVSDLGRSYFITTWRWSNGLWECDCICDVLGTYKSSILAMDKYVTRCYTKSYANLYLTDDMYPVSTETDHSTFSLDLGWSRTWQSGWYVVGMVAHSSISNAGSVEYWVLSAVELKSLVNFMLSGLGTTDWTATSWKQEWERIMADPFQYIVSCMYFPFQPPMDSTASYISFGYWTTNLQGHLLLGPYQQYTYSLNCFLGNNQDAFGYVNHADLPDYYYMSPYSVYALNMQPFGTIEIDGMLAVHQQNIGMMIKVDFISGVASASFYAYSGSSFNRFDRFLTSTECQLGVQVQLSQNTSSLIQRVGQTASTFFGGLASAAFSPSSGLAAAGKLISSTLTEPFNGSFEHRSTGGGIAMLEGIMILHVYRRYPAQYDASKFGWPCCKSLTLTNLSGYVQCADGTNTVAATLQEKEMISDYLENGFFIE